MLQLERTLSGVNSAWGKRTPDRWRRILSALLAIAIVFGGAYSSTAMAFEPDIFDPAVGEDGEPQITSTVTHGPAWDVRNNMEVSPQREPRWGDNFFYTFTWKVKNVNSSASSAPSTLNLRINLDDAAHLTRGISNADISLPRGWTVTSVQGNGKGSGFDIVIDTHPERPGSPKEGTISIKKLAVINAKNAAVTLAEGANVWASTQAELKENISLEWAGHESSFTPDSGYCSGIHTYTWKNRSGAWLADLKFGDANGQGKVELDAAPLTSGSGRNTIQVIDAQGRDITDQVLKRTLWKGNDPSASYQPNPYAAQYPALRWLQSLNWYVDPSTYTGDTWLPAGSTVTVRKGVSYKNCIVGIATDWDRERPVEALLEIVRPILPVKDNAVDVFTMPGEPQGSGPWCENSMYYNENYIGHDFGSITLDTATIGTDNPTMRVDVMDQAKTPYGNGPSSRTMKALYKSVAVSPDFPNILFFMARSEKVNAGYFNGLVAYDMKTKQVVGIAPMTGGPLIHREKLLGLGFDRHNVLWAIEEERNGKGLISGKGRAWYIDLSGLNSDLSNATSGNFRWVKAHSIDTGINNDAPYDIAFDFNDDAYLVTGSGRGLVDSQGKLIRFEADEWKREAAKGQNGALDLGSTRQKDWHPSVYEGTVGNAARDYEKIVAVFRMGKGREYRGLAFGPDGALYAGKPNDNMWRVDLIDKTTGELLPENQRVLTEVTVSARTKAVSAYTGNVFPAVDMSGCNFGQQRQSSDPKFQLQKSVVDPLTGEVIEPGKASKNPVALSDTNMATIDYLVSVKNVGAKAGTPAQISDSVQIPQGFELVDVSVDGQSREKKIHLHH